MPKDDNKTVVIHFRVEETLRDESQELFEKMGINMTTALNMFLRRCIITQSIPFPISANADTETKPK